MFTKINITKNINKNINNSRGIYLKVLPSNMRENSIQYTPGINISKWKPKYRNQFTFTNEHGIWKDIKKDHNIYVVNNFNGTQFHSSKIELGESYKITDKSTFEFLEVRGLTLHSKNVWLAIDKLFICKSIEGLKWVISKRLPKYCVNMAVHKLLILYCENKDKEAITNLIQQDYKIAFNSLLNYCSDTGLNDMFNFILDSIPNLEITERTKIADKQNFLVGCKDGYMDIVKFFVDKNKTDSENNDFTYEGFPKQCVDYNENFLVAAKMQQVEVIKFIWDNCTIDEIQKIDHYEFLKIITQKYNMELVNFYFTMLEGLDQYTINSHINNFLAIACDNNNLELAKYVRDISESGFNVTIYPDTIEKIFERACIKGHLMIVKWVYSTFTFDKRFPFMFNHACVHDNINIAQWIYNHKTNFKVDLTSAFKACCANGNIKSAQWVLELAQTVKFQVDIYDVDIEHCVNEGYYDVLKYLQSLDVRNKFNINEYIE